MANVATAVVATAVQAAKAVVAPLLAAPATFRRLHTRGVHAMCTYGVQGSTGVVFMPCALFAGAQPPTTFGFATTPYADGGELVFAAMCKGHKAGIAGYRVAKGGSGVVNIDAQLLPVPVPTTLYTSVVLTGRQALPAGATSAVVAAGNVAAHEPAAPVATPAQVAAVVAQGAAVVVAVSKGKAGKGKAGKAVA